DVGTLGIEILQKTMLRGQIEIAVNDKLIERHRLAIGNISARRSIQLPGGAAGKIADASSQQRNEESELVRARNDRSRRPLNKIGGRARKGRGQAWAVVVPGKAADDSKRGGGGKGQLGGGVRSRR